MTFETNDNYSIQFEIPNNSSTIQFDSIQNEKNTVRTALEFCAFGSVSSRLAVTLSSLDYQMDFIIDWVTLSFRNTNIFHQTTGLTPN